MNTSLFSGLTGFTRWVTVCLIIFCIPVIVTGQAVGDYRTAATGNWSNLNTWQRLNALPATWATPSAAQGYPGQFPGTGSVSITGERTVTVTADVPNTIGSLEIQGESGFNIVQFSGPYALNVAGTVAINPPTTAANNYNGLFVNSGIVTCISLTSSDFLKSNS